MDADKVKIVLKLTEELKQVNRVIKSLEDLCDVAISKADYAIRVELPKETHKKLNHLILMGLREEENRLKKEIDDL